MAIWRQIVFSQQNILEENKHDDSTYFPFFLSTDTQIHNIMCQEFMALR